MTSKTQVPGNLPETTKQASPAAKFQSGEIATPSSLQRNSLNRQGLASRDVLQLQPVIGNRAVQRLLPAQKKKKQPSAASPSRPATGISVIQRTINSSAKKNDIVINYVNNTRHKIDDIRNTPKGLEYKLIDDNTGNVPPITDKSESQNPSLPKENVVADVPLSPTNLTSSSETEVPPPPKVDAPPPPKMDAPPPPKIKPPSSTSKISTPKPGGTSFLEALKQRGPVEPVSTQEFEKVLWISASDPNYGLEGDKEARRFFDEKEKREKERVKKQEQDRLAREKAELLPKELFTGSSEGSFEWWFSYMWKEVPPCAEKLEIFNWQEAYKRNPGIFDNAQKLLILQSMLDLGFSLKLEDEFKPVSELYEGNQGERTAYHKTLLPSLKDTGLVYRSDSRDPGTIKKHGGSLPRSRLDTQAKDIGMDEPWNPFQDKRLRQALFIRMGSKDNDLFTAVSLAIDPRDAVKFPLPGSEKYGGERVTGGKDNAHLYVIWIEKALDTTRIAHGDKPDPFGRGEVAGVNVPYNTHLIHIETERAFDDKSVAYVAGRVTKLELLQSNEVIEKLPETTRKALYDVMKLLGSELRWLVHGTPEKDNPRHEQIENLIKHDKQLRALGIDAQIMIPPGFVGEMASLAKSIYKTIENVLKLFELPLQTRSSLAETYKGVVEQHGTAYSIMKNSLLKTGRLDNNQEQIQEMVYVQNLIDVLSKMLNKLQTG